MFVASFCIGQISHQQHKDQSPLHFIGVNNDSSPSRNSFLAIHAKMVIKTGKHDLTIQPIHTQESVYEESSATLVFMTII